MLKFFKEFLCINIVLKVLLKSRKRMCVGRVKMLEDEEQGQCDCTIHGSVFVISKL